MEKKPDQLQPVRDALQLAILIARDDGLPRRVAEAILWKIYRKPPGTPLD